MPEHRFYWRRWGPQRLLDGVENSVTFPEIAVTTGPLIINKDLARAEAGRTQQARQRMSQAFVAAGID